MSGVNNRKFVIAFRSSQVRQGHSCIRYITRAFNMSSDISVFGTCPRQNSNAHVVGTFSVEEFFRPSVRLIYGVEVIAIKLES